MSYFYPDSSDRLVYTLDEAAAPFANRGTVGALPLAITGSVTPNQPGKWGQCCLFPGSGAGRLDSGDTSVGECVYPVTLSGWVYLLGYTVWGTFFGKQYFTGSTWNTPYLTLRICLDDQNAGRMQYLVTTANGQFGGYAGHVSLNAWHHIGETYDGAFVCLYMDGKLIDRQPATGAIDWGSHGKWLVGGDPINYGTLNGYVDDVRFANVARNEAWFKQAYEGVLQREAIVIKSGIPTIIGTDTLRADLGAHAGLTTTGLASGDAVQVSGALTLGKAVNTSASPIIGIYDGVAGSVVQEGVVVATFAAGPTTAGETVYLSSTAGQLTNVKPTADMIHEVGVVVDVPSKKVLLQQKPVIALPSMP